MVDFRSLTMRFLPRVIRRSFRAKLFVAFFLVGSLASVDAVQYIGRLMWRAQRTEVQTALYATVIQMAESLDGDVIASLHDATSMQSADGQARQRALLEQMSGVLADGIRVRGNDALAETVTVDWYVIGPTADPGIGELLIARHPEEVGRSYDMSRFPRMIEAWQHPTVESRPYTDEYGSTLSAYAPIHDASGAVVAIVGIDSDASYYRAVLMDVLVIALLMLLAGVAVSLLFAWLLSRMLTRSLAALSTGMQQVADGDLDVRMPITGAGDEFDALFLQFNDMASGLAERQAIKSDLDRAASIQSRLLPRTEPEVAGFEFSGGIRYSDETGGDYFDFIDLSGEEDQRLAIVVGDVTGHGIASALTMCSNRAVLRASAHAAGSDVGALLRSVNAAMVSDSPTGAFMTTFYGVLHPESCQFEWSNAGHEPGLLLRHGSGAIERLESGDIPLGIDHGREFPAGETVRFDPGDVLVIGTDGISEARSRSGSFFGLDQMATIMREHKDATARGMRDAILHAAEMHHGSRAFADDATLVVVKRDQEVAPLQ